MFKRFRNRKLGFRIALIVAVMMVLSLTAVGIISFNSSSEALLTQYETSLTTEAVQTAQIVADGVKLIKYSMERTATTVAFYINNADGIKAALSDKQQELGYMHMCFTGLNGAVSSADGTYVDLSGEEGFQQALSGGIVLNRPIVYEGDGELYLYAFAPVARATGNIEGVLTAMIPYDTLYQLIGSIQIGETGYAVILDENGTTAAHPVTDKVISKENAIELAKSNSDLDALSSIVQKCINRETGFEQYYYNGTVKFMAYAPISDMPWSVMLAVPKAELYASIDQQMYMVIVSSAASLAIVMAILLLFVRTQIRTPLKKITELAAALASGQLDATNTIRSSDEIGQLSATLDGEVRQAFVTIEQSRIVAEKRAHYESAEVNKLIVNLERLSSGELFCDMAAAESDDDTQTIGELFANISENMHLTVNTLRSYIEEVALALSAMSTGDLTWKIESEYRGDFVSLRESINSIAVSLNKMMFNINTASEQVAAGTLQVSEGSQAISQGATEQAGAIEELSATLAQIADQTKHNANSASRANELTLAAKRSAALGDGQMKAMQGAMAEINEASESISRIIKVIDDIAFQTNILSLNAAVEAARAGIHGKGFAVVADEVRNLAARSASAAKETTALIEGSMKKTAAGTKIANETAAALSGIIEGVDKAAQLVSEIAAASGEQADAIAQVNRGIEQMGQVVQSNSATSEETAASAEELSSQAELLKSMVGRFKLQNTAGPDDSKAGDAVGRSPEPHTVRRPQIDLSDNEFGKY